MRTYRLRRHALAACLALLVPLGFATACQNAAGGSAAEGKLANVSPSSSSSPASSSSSSPAPSSSSSAASSPGSSPYAAAFLATGHCASREGVVGDTKDFHDVACTSERATARVLVRRDGTAAKGAAVACPLNTDFVLYVAESPPAAEGGGGSVARGYACMRNLEAPHPGDPGAGGGPYTVVGDCVYDAGAELVKETACDGSGVNAPQFKVVSAVARRPACPASTALYVQLTGGKGAVGCARRV